MIRIYQLVNFIKKNFFVDCFKDYRNPEFYKNVDLILILTPSGSHFKICEFFFKKKNKYFV